MFGLSFEEKVNKAVEGLAAHGIHNPSGKIDDKVVTLSGVAHDVAAKTKAMIWFNEQVDTDNTINLIQVEVPNKPGGMPVPGAKPASPAFPGVVSGSSSTTSGGSNSTS